MRGDVLHYDDNTGVGQISGSDGIRYNFERAGLKQLTPIKAGTQVDFDFEGKSAFDIYVVAPAAAPAGTPGVAPARYTGPVEPDLGLFGYYKRTITANYANFNGRARRKEYWGFALVNIIVLVVLGILALVAGAGGSGNGSPSPAASIVFVIAGIYTLALLIPGIAVGVRRLHDIGASGWWMLGFILASAIPFVGFLVSIAMIVVFCLDSQPHENKFGVPPKAM